MKLSIGSNISWECALGNLKGTIINIINDLNGMQEMIEWLVIKTDETTICLANTESNIAMMKVRVI